MKKLSRLTLQAIALSVMISCSGKKNEGEAETAAADGSAGTTGKIKLVTLDPGHFHSALVQKTSLNNVDSTVHVYAPVGEDVQEHLKKIEGYNARAENPTTWKTEVYTGDDYLQKMLADKPGNVVVLAGNNAKKTEYIKASVEAGLNVLADKPMAINSEDFELLKESFNIAEKKDLLLYDIMTERYEITSMLQREFSMIPEFFGTLQKGSVAEPAITKESVHHFFKNVSGSPIKRPSWFFDVTQQGEGIVDVTTHLVDLVQWAAFPEQIIDYKKDVEILNARRWQTHLRPSEFKKVTRLMVYPDNLKKVVARDSLLEVFSNGEINYKIKDSHAKVSVIWNFEAPEGAGDTHFSIMRGTKANLIINQGKEQGYKPVLYLAPAATMDISKFEENLKGAVAKVQAKYPGVEVKKEGKNWVVIAPEKYHNGHEAHFGQVAEKYLGFLAAGEMPKWEVPNMLTKYYITTKALEMAKQNK